MSNSDFDFKPIIYVLGICMYILAIMFILSFVGVCFLIFTPSVVSMFYPEESQFKNIYKLKDSEEKVLLHLIDKGMKIVDNKLPGKEGFFDDVIPVTSYSQSISNNSDQSKDILCVRYKKDFFSLVVFYDDFIKQRMGYKNWNRLSITAFDNRESHGEIGYRTLKISWNKNTFEKSLHLKFLMKEDVKYQYGHLSRRGNNEGGTAKKYYFISTQDPKIHVNFITEVILADKVKGSSDYPKFFASIEIYKENDEKNQILADDRRKKEQAEQQRQDAFKRKQQERKAEALKQLGIQE